MKPLTYGVLMLVVVSVHGGQVVVGRVVMMMMRVDVHHRVGESVVMMMMVEGLVDHALLLMQVVIRHG